MRSLVHGVLHNMNQTCSRTLDSRLRGNDEEGAFFAGMTKKRAFFAFAVIPAKAGIQGFGSGCVGLGFGHRLPPNTVSR